MKAIRKNFFREIRYSLGRFLSILFIVALGTAFFSGIRATEPDMRASMDAFVREHHFMDLRVRSSLGLTQEDVKALGALDRRAFAMDVYTSIYLRSDALHTSGTYDAAYKNGVEQLKQRAASMADERCGIRLANLKQDIRKAEKKLSAKRADLVEAKKKYRDAREELAHKKADTREKFADAEKTLKDRERKIGDGIAAYRKNKQKLEEQEQ